MIHYIQLHCLKEFEIINGNKNYTQTVLTLYAPTLQNCLSVFDHFVRLALRGLKLIIVFSSIRKMDELKFSFRRTYIFTCFSRGILHGGPFSIEQMGVGKFCYLITLKISWIRLVYIMILMVNTKYFVCLWSCFNCCLV